MTSIGSITPQTVDSNTISGTGDLMGNYETFITLLTTQLQHQDPTEPMDTNQFTEQLVQYSAIEQQIKTNDQLENLGAMLTSSNALGALGFVNTTVTIDGSKAYLNEYGPTDFAFNAASSGTADVTIFDAKGGIVYHDTNIQIAAGDQAITWDGDNNSGSRMDSGVYSILINAVDPDGNDITLTSDYSGQVTNVNFSSSEPMLEVGGQTIQMSQIKAVN